MGDDEENILEKIQHTAVWRGWKHWCGPRRCRPPSSLQSRSLSPALQSGCVSEVWATCILGLSMISWVLPVRVASCTASTCNLRGPFPHPPVYRAGELPGWWSSQGPHRKQMWCSSGTSPGRVIYKGGWAGRGASMGGGVGPRAGGSASGAAMALSPRASRERADWSPERRGHGQKPQERAADHPGGAQDFPPDHCRPSGTMILHCEACSGQHS